MFVAFIGISRLYLGVHFLHDVLVGWLVGAFVLWAFIKNEDRLAAWFNGQGLQSQIGLGFLLSLAVIAAGQLIQLWLTGITDPPAWAAFAAQARNASYAFTQAGALFGALTGYVLMRKNAPFEGSKSWLRSLGCYMVGIAGLLLVYNGLDVLFASLAPDETLLGYALRYLRYATVTFLVTFLAPWLFVRIGLADRQAALPPSRRSQASPSKPTP